MIDPEHYMYADLSLTDIEGPAEFYDWEAEERAMESLDIYESWMGIIQQMVQDEKDSAPADEYGDQMFEALAIPEEDLGW